MEANKIIVKPLLSEKSYSDIKKKKYWFVVDRNATKPQIKKAVEEVFGVQVETVNTSLTAPKPKKRNSKSATGYTSTIKKAIVTLTKESKPIAFFESLS